MFKISVIKITKFQSTLPRRERRLSIKIISEAFWYFNPRSREGSDFLSLMDLAYSSKFQSTLPRRERQCFCIFVITYNIFQSTLPRRERQNLSNIMSQSDYFNPRSREGSDVVFLPHVNYSSISIHAPAKGATIPCNTFPQHLSIFQSTLPRRERQQYYTTNFIFFV